MTIKDILKRFKKGEVGDHGHHRGRMVRLAVISSFGSKITGVLLQGVAIPLVYHALGDKMYALYLLLGAALGTLALTQFGAGAGLTQTIARYNALEDRAGESAAFCAALALSAGMAMIGAIAVLTVVHNVPVSRLFGQSFAADSSVIMSTVNTTLAIFVMMVLFGVIDSVLAGYQEQFYTNLGTLTTNLLSTLLLFVVCQHRPSLNTVFLVMYGAVAAARLVNLVQLLSRRRYLLAGWLHVQRNTFTFLLNTGMAFWLVEIALIIEQQGGTYVMSHLSTPHETDIFAVCYRVTALCGSAGFMITQPLWPAFTDAVVRKEYAWVQRTSRKIRTTLLLVGIIMGGILAIAGPWLITTIWHIRMSGDRLLVATLGLYLFLNVWANFHYVMLMGLDRIWSVAWIIVAENMLVLTLGVLLVPRLGSVGMSLAYIGGSLLAPAWLLPLILTRRLRTLAPLNDETNPPLNGESHSTETTMSHVD